MKTKEISPKVSYEFDEENIDLLAEVIAQKIKKHFDVKSPAEEKDKIMWIDDASKFLNLAKPTIYGLTSKGLIPNYRRGRKLYFLKSELEQWLLEGKRKTQADIEKEVDTYLNRNSQK